MSGDIIAPPKHAHRWFFLQTRTEIESEHNNVGPEVYIKVEYAYFVCNNCTPDGQPSVIKRKVTTKE